MLLINLCISFNGVSGFEVYLGTRPRSQTQKPLTEKLLTERFLTEKLLTGESSLKEEEKILLEFFYDREKNLLRQHLKHSVTSCLGFLGLTLGALFLDAKMNVQIKNLDFESFDHESYSISRPLGIWSKFFLCLSAKYAVETVCTGHKFWRLVRKGPSNFSHR